MSSRILRNTRSKQARIYSHLLAYLKWQKVLDLPLAYLLRTVGYIIIIKDSGTVSGPGSKVLRFIGQIGVPGAPRADPDPPASHGGAVRILRGGKGGR